MGHYTYWSGLPVVGFENVVRPNRGWGAAPTNDGLTMVVVDWPYAEAPAYIATLAPPPPQMQQLLVGAIHGNQEAMDGVAGVTAGTVSPAEYFAPRDGHDCANGPSWYADSPARAMAVAHSAVLVIPRARSVA